MTVKSCHNIVIILLDDMGFWTANAYENMEIPTLNIDDLAKRGLTFDNCDCASPVCLPARASLLTGRIPAQHGVADWIRKGLIDSADDQTVKYLRGMRGFSDVFADNGYVGCLIGILHLGDSDTPQKGFTQWTTILRGSGNYYGATLYRDGHEEAVDHDITHELNDAAIHFVPERANAQDCYFLSLNYTAPHRRWKRPEHPAKFWDKYDECTFQIYSDEPTNPSQFNDDIYSGEDYVEMVRRYCTALTEADAAMGRVVDVITALGQTENTQIILSSDNGRSLGRHRTHGKGNATYPQNIYDQAVKVPFILVQPCKITARKSDALIGNRDFCPTRLYLLDIERRVAENWPGRSFLPHILSDTDAGRDDVVIFDERGPVSMLRDAPWKFVLRMWDWENQLFDMQADPDERINLINNYAHQDVANALESRLNGWFKTYVDPVMDAGKQQFFGHGQLGMIPNRTAESEPFSNDWFYMSSGQEDLGLNHLPYTNGN
jgi:choline-sulfatase